MIQVTKAVFSVAVLGTRFRSATKEMSQITDKSINQYAVEEVIAAGITDLVFVTGCTSRDHGSL